METVYVSIAADDLYFPGMATAAVSIALSASREVKLCFVLLDGGIRSEKFDKFSKRLVELHPNVEIVRVEIDETRFSRFPDWRGNKMAYARFLLPEILKDAPFVIYCDADFFWREDIAKLWGLRDSQVALQAVHDPLIGTVPSNRKWFERNNYSYDESSYVCSGLLLMNLEKFRKECLIDKIYKFLKQHPDVMFPDQDAINVVLKNEIRLLDSKWMRFTNTLKSDEMCCEQVWHYVNDLPWRAMTRYMQSWDVYFPWLKMAELAGVSQVGKKVCLMYHLTRTPVLRELLYLYLICSMRANLVIELKRKACNKF